jgi:hypothetical protein
MDWPGNDSSYPGLLEVDFGGCSRFATVRDGIVTPLANRSGHDHTYGRRFGPLKKVGLVQGAEGFYDVATSRVQKAGFDLPYNAAAAAVKQQLELLSPVVASPMGVVVSVPDDQDGQTWTLSYYNNDGDVPEVWRVCLA